MQDFWPFSAPTYLDVEMRFRAQLVLELFRRAVLRKALNRLAVICKQLPNSSYGLEKLPINAVQLGLAPPFLGH